MFADLDKHKLQSLLTYFLYILWDLDLAKIDRCKIVYDHKIANISRCENNLFTVILSLLQNSRSIYKKNITKVVSSLTSIH